MPNRLQKHSRLVLEKRPLPGLSPEVHAVVFRWTEPGAVDVQVLLSSALEVESEYLDGQELDSDCANCKPGWHVLAFVVADLGQRRGKWQAPWLHGAVRNTGALPEDSAVLAVSRPGPNWQLAAEEPPGAWYAAAYDDSAWQPGGRWTGDRARLGPAGKYRFDSLASLGAEALEVPAERAWVRWRFLVPEGGQK